jgi:hypothetical protein
MNYIESFFQDPEILWDDINLVHNQQYAAMKMGGLAAAVVVVDFLLLPPSAVIISGIACTILFFNNIALIQNHDFFKDRNVQILGYATTIVITLLALYHLKILAVLPLFQGMCHYSAYLQLKGLTREKIDELYLERIKKVIASEESELAPELLDPFKISFGQLEDYSQIHFGFYRCSDTDFQDLLLFAYSNKKILTFGPKALTFLSSLFESISHKRFAMSVDYLVNCKKKFPNLDEKFVNAQLKYMATSLRPQLWGPSVDEPFAHYLSLENGIPTIRKADFFGDISKLKQKLVDCFGSVVEMN